MLVKNVFNIICSNIADQTSSKKIVSLTSL